jgi:hypothetical protein
LKSSAALVARGKMYKRDTFGHLALHSELVRGVVQQEVMKKKETEVRKKMVVVRLNDDEYLQLKINRKKSTEKTTSAYLRKVALMQPVTIIYRNGSADDFLKEMLLLQKELNAIGNNFNQAVHKLHTLDRIPEFRKWILDYATTHKQFLLKSEEISDRAYQIYQQWSHV